MILLACAAVLGSVAVVAPARRPPAEVAYPQRSLEEPLLPLPGRVPLETER